MMKPEITKKTSTPAAPTPKSQPDRSAAWNSRTPKAANPLRYWIERISPGARATGPVACACDPGCVSTMPRPPRDFSSTFVPPNGSWRVWLRRHAQAAQGIAEAVKLAYFVHDLTDPAVTRRVRMLRAGGAQPVVIGFRRAEAAPCDIAGAAAVDLGRTYDGRFGQRAFKAAMAALSAPRWRSLLRDCDVVLARMLEMLFVADAARRVSGSRARLVYECLDVHRLMVASGAKAEGLRRLERALLARCDLLVVSSPAFLENYFEPVQGVGRGIPLRSLLVENKLLELGGPPARHQPAPPRRPWRIAWLGAIRCRRSLAILSDLARRR